jgi:plastocyanin
MAKTLFGLAVLIAALALTAAALAAGQAPIRHASLTVIHVQKGCHIWTVGQRQLVSPRVPLARGGTITFRNHDVDGHRLVQVAGPAKLHLAKLGMNGRAVVKFTKPGVYRLRTKTFEMMGMPEMKTTGPDNTLKLTVVVS